MFNGLVGALSRAEESARGTAHLPHAPRHPSRRRRTGLDSEFCFRRHRPSTPRGSQSIAASWAPPPSSAAVPRMSPAAVAAATLARPSGERVRQPSSSCAREQLLGRRSSRGSRDDGAFQHSETLVYLGEGNSTARSRASNPSMRSVTSVRKSRRSASRSLIRVQVGAQVAQPGVHVSVDHSDDDYHCGKSDADDGEAVGRAHQRQRSTAGPLLRNGPRRGAEARWRPTRWRSLGVPRPACRVAGGQPVCEGATPHWFRLTIDAARTTGRSPASMSAIGCSRNRPRLRRRRNGPGRMRGLSGTWCSRFIPRRS